MHSIFLKRSIAIVFAFMLLSQAWGDTKTISSGHWETTQIQVSNEPEVKAWNPKAETLKNTAPENKSSFWFSIDSGFIVAIIALWLALCSFKSNNHVCLSVIGCSSSARQTLGENSEKIFYHFVLRIKNKGICLHSPTVKIRVRKKDEGSFTFQLVRKAQQKDLVNEFAKGMIAEFYLKSYQLDKEMISYLGDLAEASQKDACLEVYSQGYLVKTLRASGIWDRTKDKWNGIAFNLNRRFDREIGKTPQGIPMIKPGKILPKFTIVLGFRLNNFLQAMKRESNKDQTS